MQNGEFCYVVNFAIPGDHRVETKGKGGGGDIKIWQENYKFYGTRKYLLFQL